MLMKNLQRNSTASAREIKRSRFIASNKQDAVICCNLNSSWAAAGDVCHLCNLLFASSIPCPPPSRPPHPLPRLRLVPCVLLQTKVRPLTNAMLAILGEHVIWLAAAPEMSRRLLHAVVLAAAVADGTRMDSCKRNRRQKTSGGRHLEQPDDASEGFCDWILNRNLSVIGQDFCRGRCYSRDEAEGSWFSRLSVFPLECH